ncbi:SRPBCC domain-containing protein [Sinomonas halotolerans]|uniref:SRPBCC domain-containing protein n=1 Tax=Sinomonas halotolerans TaxID=1644133 RepID=A0ABU9X057_9MICC
MTESHPFEIVQDVLIDAAPERIWQALTEDTAAWMYPFHEAYPHERVAEEYPARLVQRMEGEGGWYNQLEYVLTPGPEGTHLHYVHSSVLTDDWERQYDAAVRHTAFYLHTLAEYLAHFDGRPVAFSEVQGPDGAAAPDAFELLVGSLGLLGAIPGEKRDLDVPGLGPAEVTVDYLEENFLGLRTEDLMVRVFGRQAYGHRVGLTVHDFSTGEGSDGDRTAKAAANAEAWSAYLEGLYG